MSKQLSLCLILAILTLPAFANQGLISNNAQLGPRPFYLVDQMSESPLKNTLQQCANRTLLYRKSDFSIGHRGAPMQFPEHTRESYMAAARMGAGILECDVTFTKDRELVCRHAQCDLHTTTNIVASALAQKCSVPPELDADGTLLNAAAIRCCTSDITLAEFKTLEGKMDAANQSAESIDEYLNATANWRTDLYSGGARGTLLSHAESIELFKQLRVGMTPELKSADVDMPYAGEYTQEDYAQQMIDEYIAAAVSPDRVWPQSFNYEDILYWVDNNPEFGRQAVFLDNRYSTDVASQQSVDALVPSMYDLVADGVNIIAPPMQMLLQTDQHDQVVPAGMLRLPPSLGSGLSAGPPNAPGNLILMVEDSIMELPARSWKTTAIS